MTSDLNLDVALKILKAAGHQIGGAHIPAAPHGDAMRIWIDGVPCTLTRIRREFQCFRSKWPEKPAFVSKIFAAVARFSQT